MSENNKGRYVQISNFRNIGVSEQQQNICINRSIKNDYIGNLVLLIGPNNSGKSNVLDALSILNSDASFSYNDLPYSIKNPKEGTFIKLYDDVDKTNELVTKSTNGKKVSPSHTFNTWIENVKRNIDAISSKYMQNYGYNNKSVFNSQNLAKVYWNNQQFNTINDFLNSINNWSLKQFINNKWWEKSNGRIEIQRPNNEYYAYNTNIIKEPILTPDLVNYLNEVINDQNDPMCKLITTEDKSCTIKFLKYKNWKIDNSFLKLSMMENEMNSSLTYYRN